MSSAPSIETVEAAAEGPDPQPAIAVLVEGGDLAGAQARGIPRIDAEVEEALDLAIPDDAGRERVRNALRTLLAAATLVAESVLGRRA